VYRMFATWSAESALSALTRALMSATCSVGPAYVPSAMGAAVGAAVVTAVGGIAVGAAVGELVTIGVVVTLGPDEHAATRIANAATRAARHWADGRMNIACPPLPHDIRGRVTTSNRPG
jgi:hypothetical protein